jgi:hypothetical protein
MDMFHQKRDRSAPRFLVLASLAWSEMLHRRGASLVNALVAALTTTLLILSGYYSWAIVEGLKHQAAQSPFRRVVAFGSGARFDEATLADLGRLPGVRLALPGIELNVEVSIAGGKPRSVPAEGVQSGDGSVDPSRLCWGRPLRDDAREIVLSRPLYRYLGGRMSPAGVPLDTLDVVLTRSVKGAVQTYHETLPIAGLLELQSRDQILLPLAVIDGLNLWADNKVDSPKGETKARRLVYPDAIGYVPAEDEARVQDAAAALKIKAVRLGEIVVEEGGETWVRLARTDGTAITAEQTESLGGTWDTHAVLQIPSIATTVALLPDDPRWAGAPPANAMLRGLSKAVATPKLANATRTDDQPLNRLVGADVACTFDTLINGVHDWRQDPRSLDRVWVRSSELWSAIQVMKSAGSSSHVESFPTWAVMPPPPLEGGAFEELYQDLKSKALSGRMALHVATCSVGSGTSVRGKTRVASTTIRIVPDAILGQIAPAWRSDADDMQVVQVRPDGPAELKLERLGEHPVRVVKEIRGNAEEIWISDRDAGKLTVRFKKEGLAIWGDPMAVLKTLDALPVEWHHNAGIVETPAAISGLLQPKDAAMPSWASNESMQVRPIRVLPMRVGDRDIFLTGQGELDNPPSTMPSERGAAQARRIDGLPDLETIPCSNLPNGLFVVPTTALNSFSRKSISSADPTWLPAGIVAGIDVRVHDPLELTPLQIFADRFGLTLRRLSEPPHRKLVRFTISGGSGADGRIDDTLAARLGEADPFVACIPVRRLPGAIGGVPASFVTSDPSDPDRFSEKLLLGHWLGDGAARSAVIPKDLLGGATPESVVGKTVNARFQRKNYANQTEEADVPLIVRGVTAGKRVYVSRSVLDDVAGWQSGELICNTTEGRFKTPLETARLAGYERAVLWAIDDEHVEGLVGDLRAKGYRTEDQVAAQQGLREMQKVLTGMVIFLCGLPFFQGLIALIRERQSYLAAKRFEIGVLKALGFRRLDLAVIYAIQGFFIGSASFAGAMFVALAGDPLLIRSWVAKILSLSPEQFRGTVFSADVMGVPVWLVALLVSVGSMLLASLPTLRAAGMQVVTLFAERD